MDEWSKILKSSLDDHVYKGLEMTETNKHRFIATIKNRSPKKEVRRFNFLIPGIAVILVLLLGTVLLKSLFPGESNAAKLIEKEAVKAFGMDVVVPVFEKYPITFAAITMPNFLNEPSDLKVIYSDVNEETNNESNNEKEIRAWELTNESKLLYGSLNAKALFDIEYRKGKVIMGDSGGESETINGIDVQYKHVKRDAGEFYFVTLNSDGGSYNMRFTLSPDFTAEEVEKLLEQFTVQLKR